MRRAVELYVAERDARESRREGRTVRSNASHRLHRYVLGQDERGRAPAVLAAPVANIALYALTERDLQAWRDGLPDELKASTRKRLVNDFKAGLNAAAATNRSNLPATLPGTIKHGLKVPGGEDDEPVARDNQILSDGQVAQLIAAAKAVDSEHGEGGDLYRMVLTLAATGRGFAGGAAARLGLPDRCRPPLASGESEGQREDWKYSGTDWSGRHGRACTGGGR